MGTRGGAGRRSRRALAASRDHLRRRVGRHVGRGRTARPRDLRPAETARHRPRRHDSPARERDRDGGLRAGDAAQGDARTPARAARATLAAHRGQVRGGAALRGGPARRARRSDVAGHGARERPLESWNCAGPGEPAVVLRAPALRERVCRRRHEECPGGDAPDRGLLGRALHRRHPPRAGRRQPGARGARGQAATAHRRRRAPGPRGGPPAARARPESVPSQRRGPRRRGLLCRAAPHD